MDKRKKHYQKPQWGFGLERFLRPRWGVSQSRIGAIDPASTSWWRNRAVVDESPVFTKEIFEGLLLRTELEKYR